MTLQMYAGSTARFSSTTFHQMCKILRNVLVNFFATIFIISKPQMKKTKQDLPFWEMINKRNDRKISLISTSYLDTKTQTTSCDLYDLCAAHLPPRDFYDLGMIYHLYSTLNNFNNIEMSPKNSMELLNHSGKMIDGLFNLGQH